MSRPARETKAEKEVKVTAYHEAGHAVAYLRVMGGFYAAHVRHPDQRTITDEHGSERPHYAGLIEGPFFDLQHYMSRAQLEASDGLSGDGKQRLIRSAHADMVIDLAGPCAEARYRHCSLAAVLITAGRGDYAKAEATAAWLSTDANQSHAAAFNAAEAKARALVRSEWGLVVQIADVLVDRGYIDMDHPLLAAYANIEVETLPPSSVIDCSTWTRGPRLRLLVPAVVRPSSPL